MNLWLPAIGAAVGILSSKTSGTWKGATSTQAVKMAVIGAGIGAAISYAAEKGVLGGGISHMDQLGYIYPGYHQPYLRSMGPQFDSSGLPNRVKYY